MKINELQKLLLLALGCGHGTRTRLRAETLHFGVQARLRYFGKE